MRPGRVGYAAAMTTDDSGFLGLIGAGPPQHGDASASMSVELDERHLNPAGTVHGGLLATLVDTAMGAAVRTTTDDAVPATSQLTVTYLRPAEPGEVSVTASVGKRGEAITVCEATIEQHGRPVVHALATFALG